jgi:hypothetical protein
LGRAGGGLTPEAALLHLACHATGRDLPSEDRRRLTVEAIPGVSTALENVRRYKDWAVHGPRYHPEAIQKHFRLQCWTLKPAFTAAEYDSRLELGRDLSPMFERMP